MSYWEVNKGGMGNSVRHGCIFGLKSMVCFFLETVLAGMNWVIEPLFQLKSSELRVTAVRLRSIIRTAQRKGAHANTTRFALRVLSF